MQKLIEEITPFYSPEAIQEFKRDKEKVQVIEKKKALKNTVKSFEIENIFYRKDPRKLFANTLNVISEKLAELLKRKGPFKASLTLQVELKKSFTRDGKIFFEHVPPYFNSPTFTITNEFEIKLELEQAEEKILNRIANWISRGSGFVIEIILTFFVNIVSYVPLKARSHLPLSEELRNPHKGLINLHNNDNKCFLWSHIRHINPLERNPQRITLKDKELVKTLDYSGVTFPVSIKDMGKIEKQNKININVLGYTKGEPHPIRSSKENYEDTLNVLLIEEEKEEKEKEEMTLKEKLKSVIAEKTSKREKPQPIKKHYVLIKDINRFLFNFSEHETKKYFCMHCVQCFYSAGHLEKHKEDCLRINGTQKIEMPPPGSKVYFQNYQNQLPVPFVIYDDFEAILALHVKKSLIL